MSMIPSKNILYVGPYKEESNRGYYSYMNIKALEKTGHKIRIIPLFSYHYLNNKISKDIEHLENTVLDKYEICIQHCHPIQYTYNSVFEKNIGIYDFANFDPNPIINSHFLLLDKIVVNSPNKLEILAEVLSAGLYSKIQYCPQLIDLNNIVHNERKKLNWIDRDRFYFYSDLDFSEQYDWEKLIYVYLTNFMDKNTGLIIKTKNLDEEKIRLIKKQIYDMASEAKVKNIPEAMPQVLNGVYDKDEISKIHNSVNCLIDVNKANEISYSSLYFAALNKPIICNSKLSTASYFTGAFKADGMVCNSSMVYYEDIMNNSMHNYYYSINSEDLRDLMRAVYEDRYNGSRNYYENELEQYDITQINNLL